MVHSLRKSNSMCCVHVQLQLTLLRNMSASASAHAPTYCVATVVQAAPARPMPSQATKMMLPRKLTLVESSTERKGVKLSRCAMMLAWQVMMIMTAGCATARILRYRQDRGTTEACAPVMATSGSAKSCAQGGQESMSGAAWAAVCGLERFDVRMWLLR